MQSDKKYLEWCAKQKKGIKLVKESENLQKAYVKKSKEALKSMEVNANAGISEWAVSASYYAKYFIIYALLSKMGIKCEIHDCTIVLFIYLFGNDIPQQLLQDLRQAKKDRVEAQYYTSTVKIDAAELISKTKEFVLKIEEIADGIDSARISKIRKELKTVL
ncbi:MAG: HEPN domain-containing protein [Thaumarchaeota archaeon]|nr:HEPN domain-containing protein [Nitrososphaerota archaeon]